MRKMQVFFLSLAQIFSLIWRDSVPQFGAILFRGLAQIFSLIWRDSVPQFGGVGGLFFGIEEELEDGEVIQISRAVDGGFLVVVG